MVCLRKKSANGLLFLGGVVARRLRFGGTLVAVRATGAFSVFLFGFAQMQNNTYNNSQHNNYNNNVFDFHNQLLLLDFQPRAYSVLSFLLLQIAVTATTAAIASTIARPTSAATTFNACGAVISVPIV